MEMNLREIAETVDDRCKKIQEVVGDDSNLIVLGVLSYLTSKMMENIREAWNDKKLGNVPKHVVQEAVNGSTALSMLCATAMAQAIGPDILEQAEAIVKEREGGGELN